MTPGIFDANIRQKNNNIFIVYTNDLVLNLLINTALLTLLRYVNGIELMYHKFREMIFFSNLINNKIIKLHTNYFQFYGYTLNFSYFFLIYSFLINGIKNSPATIELQPQ